MLILAIDTSTTILSIALMRDDEVLASLDEQTKNNQSEILMTRIESLFNQCKVKPTQLEKIAVAVGPGSYTGIRVGVTAAKSLAYALDIPVVSVSSLEVMAQVVTSDKIRVAMIDARRGTVFAVAYDSKNQVIIPEGHYDMKGFLEKLPQGKSTFFIGDEILARKETWVTAESKLDRSKAETLAALATKMSPVASVHALVPNYLRKTEAELNLNG